MGRCEALRQTYVNNKGKNAVDLPREGVSELGIIRRDHKVKNQLGTLDRIWRSEVPVPAIGLPQIVAGRRNWKSSGINSASTRSMASGRGTAVRREEV
jgi:hypothetical protein